MKKLEELGVSQWPWKAKVKDTLKSVSSNKSGVSIYPVAKPRKGKTRAELLGEVEADCHLIAAAPELYEALRECVSQLAYASVHTKLKDSSEVFTCNAAIAKANKALRKAGGAE